MADLNVLVDSFCRWLLDDFRSADQARNLDLNLALNAASRNSKAGEGYLGGDDRDIDSPIRLDIDGLSLEPADRKPTRRGCFGPFRG